MAEQYVYRVVKSRVRTLGKREWQERKVVPMATRQRVGSIISYNNDLQADERWHLDITRARVDPEWETFTPQHIALPHDKYIRCMYSYPTPKPEEVECQCR